MNPFKLAVALWNANKEVKKMKVSELGTSPGRMALLLNIGTIYCALQGILPPVLVAKIAAGSVLGYTLFRAIVNAAEVITRLTPSPKDDAIVAEVRALGEALFGKVTPDVLKESQPK